MALRGIGNVSNNTISVKGYQNVARSYARVGKAAKRNLTKRLREAGEPVRAKAQELGPFRIQNLRRGQGPSGSDWSAVRLGVTQRLVYIAPRERGRNRNPNKRRENFKDLMLERAYEPALEIEYNHVFDHVEGIYGDLLTAWRA